MEIGIKCDNYERFEKCFLNDLQISCGSHTNITDMDGFNVSIFQSCDSRTRQSLIS